MEYRRLLTLLLIWLTIPSVSAIIAPKAILPLGDPTETSYIDASLRTPETAYRRSGKVGSGLRFYDPSLQRWINQDPIGEVGGINLYQAFVNDPVNWIDPFGTDNIFNSGAGQNAPPSLIGIYHPNLGGPVKIVPSNAGTDPFAGTAVGVAGGSLAVASLLTPGPEDLVMGAMTFRLLTTKCLTTKVDDIVEQIVEIEKAGGKVKINKSGDPIIMKDAEKVRVDLKNPHGDKPHFHHERQTPSGRWKDAGEQHRYYFPTK